MNVRKVLNADEIHQCLTYIARRIIKDYPSSIDKIVCIGVEQKGEHLASRLGRLISKQSQVNIPVGQIDVALNRYDLQRQDTCYVTLGTSTIPCDLTQKNVILVDDIIHEGRTIQAALNTLSDYGSPNQVAVAVLVDCGGRKLPISPQYVGKKLENNEQDTINVDLYELDGEDQVIVKTA